MNIKDYKERILQQRSYVDKVYWILFATIILVAVLALFSASSTLAFENDGSILGPIVEQVLFIAIGVGLAFVIQFMPSMFIRIASYFCLGLSVVLLMLTFTSMGVEINGAKRWLRIFGIVFQPSELAKLSLILVVSDLLSRIKTEQDQKKYFFIVLAITVFVCGLILVGNLSTALLLGGIVFLLFFLARIHIKYWGTTLLVIIALLFFGYLFIKKVYVEPNREVGGVMKRASTWVSRVDNMVDEWGNPAAKFELNDDNYQIIITDTPGIHKPKTKLSETMVNTAKAATVQPAYLRRVDFLSSESLLQKEGVLFLLFFSVFFFKAIISSVSCSSLNFSDAGCASSWTD